jgi:antitoxin CcdA
LTYVTVSAKIDRELREKLRRYGISISKVVKRALEEEVKRAEEEEVKRALKRIGEVLEKMLADEVVELIKESRIER